MNSVKLWIASEIPEVIKWNEARKKESSCVSIPQFARARFSHRCRYLFIEVDNLDLLE